MSFRFMLYFKEMKEYEEIKQKAEEFKQKRSIKNELEKEQFSEEEDY